jgi:hypothetical protein
MKAALRRALPLEHLRSFYSRPLGWVALLVTSVALSYGGGGAMFWLHALVRGERGPAIADWAHWLFDATLGFVALTPALFLILPAALWALRRGGRQVRVRPVAYMTLVGALFGLVTGPGPLVHNLMVGPESVLGRLAVSIFGHDPAVAMRNAHAPSHSVISEAVLQVAVGVPVYIASGAFALVLVRALTKRSPILRT